MNTYIQGKIRLSLTFNKLKKRELWSKLQHHFLMIKNYSKLYKQERAKPKLIVIIIMNFNLANNLSILMFMIQEMS